MTIYEELVQRVSDGETFYINFKYKTLKIGKKFIIKEGEYDENRTLFTDATLEMSDFMSIIEGLYHDYKYSLPSERADNKKRKYFKALSINELTDKQLLTAKRREIAQAKLEGFILCMILEGQFVWDEDELGKWFYQSKNDPDLVILRNWVENN